MVLAAALALDLSIGLSVAVAVRFAAPAVSHWTIEGGLQLDAAELDVEFAAI
jgi:hypothetical protein